MRKLALPKYKSKADFWLIMLALVLSLFGLIMVYSASYYTALSKTGNPNEYLINDLMWKILGWIGLIVFMNVDYHKLSYLAIPGVAVSFVLLLLIFTGLGVTINHATRWLSFPGLPITIMPGEIAKTALILFVAWFYSRDPSKIHDFVKGILPVAGIAMMMFVLIYAQPNLSTAGTVVLIAAGMMFVAGLSGKFIGIVCAGGISAFALALLSPKGAYMLNRVLTVLDPFKDALGDGYQIVQSLLALGSGGVTGVGLGKSIQKTLYLPESQSDFILPIVGEELGFIGILALMAVYMFLIYRCVRIAIKAPDYFGMLLASGIAIHLALQVILNIAVISATFPPTGVVLPLISLGGNATLLFLAEIGIVANISRQIKEE